MSAITALVALAAVRTTPPLTRRAVLTRGVAAAGTLATIAPASAGLLYTIVPTGSIADKEKRLAEVDKLFAKTPDDPYVFGERAQLQSDIKRLGVNKNFAGELSGELAAGLAPELHRAATAAVVAEREVAERAAREARLESRSGRPEKAFERNAIVRPRACMYVCKVR